MATRTNWHLASLADDDEGDLVADIADMGNPIDLSRDEAEIFAEIRESLGVEAYLDRIGVTCNIKQGDTAPLMPPCPTCPHFTQDPGKSLSRLCTLGRNQAALMIEHQSASLAGELADHIERARELAEAAHADELAGALL